MNPTEAKEMIQHIESKLDELANSYDACKAYEATQSTGHLDLFRKWKFGAQSAIPELEPGFKTQPEVQAVYEKIANLTAQLRGEEVKLAELVTRGTPLRRFVNLLVTLDAGVFPLAATLRQKAINAYLDSKYQRHDDRLPDHIKEEAKVQPRVAKYRINHAGTQVKAGLISNETLEAGYDVVVKAYETILGLLNEELSQLE
jgi:hypothetical protein